MTANLDPKTADQFKALGEAANRAVETIRAMGPQLGKLIKAWREATDVALARQRENRKDRS